jgi:hypothetical protein
MNMHRTADEPRSTTLSASARFGITEFDRVLDAFPLFPGYEPEGSAGAAG